MEYKAEFESTFEQVDLHARRIRQFILESNMNISQEKYFIMDYAIRELLNNAVEHGNQMMEEKIVKVFVCCGSDEIRIDVYDQGDGFELKDILTDCANSDILRYRHRGLSSIIQTGFTINVAKGHVNACIAVY